MSELHVDGNAIGGLLYDVFGADLTGARGVCAECGLEGALGGTLVFAYAPGAVVRCTRCKSVLMVVVQRATSYCVSLAGFAELDSR